MVDFVGGIGDDAWAGTEQTDNADGNEGNDSLIGNGGNDFMSGGTGADYLEGGSGDDTLYSAARAGSFNAPYYGNPWNPPVLDTGTEVDTLIGGDGNDTIFAGYGDNVDGGTSTGYWGDSLFISFMGAASGVTVDFRQSTFTIGGGTITGIEGISWVQGSNFDDDITMNSASNYYSYAPVFGMGGNDRLIAGYYTGSMWGGDGDDVVDGRLSQYMQSVDGGAGNDTLYTPTNSFASASGGDGNDTIYGHGTINGDAGNDIIHIQGSYYAGQVHGGDGDDTINAPTNQAVSAVFGDAGADTLNGGNYSDTLQGGAGNDIINGGDHLYPSTYSGDVAVYSGNIADYSASLNVGTGVVTIIDLRGGLPDGTDQLSGIEILKFANGTYSVTAVLAGQATGVINFIGTPNADSYYGSEDANTAIGYGADDTFYGFGGNDVLQGNAGADTLDGGAGDDTLYSRDQTTPFSSPYYGNPWTAPTLDVGSEADTLIGGDGSDQIFAGFNDTVDGGANGSYGDSLLISFRGAGAGVTINFNGVSVSNGTGIITGIENVNWVEGSDFDDEITMASGNGYGGFAPVFGLGGNDLLVAGYYTGSMWGGDGNDTVDGRLSQYMQSVDGGAGDDTLYTPTNSFAAAYGGDGNDTIHAHGTIEGGAGNDTINVVQSYYTGQVHGGTGDDTINVQIFGHSAIFGDEGNDQINGSAGNDTLDGGAGNDIIVGGGGANTLRGGDGSDRFEVASLDSYSVIEGGADLDTLAVSGVFSLGGASSSIEKIELIGGGVFNLSSSQFATALSATTQLAGTGSIVVTAQPGFSVNGAGFTIASGAALTLTVNGSVLGDTMTAVNGITNLLNGAGGVDTLNGGTGDDTLDGGAGANLLYGNGGNDRLVVDASGAGTSVHGGANTDTLAVSGTISLGTLSGLEVLELAAGTNLTLTSAQVLAGFGLGGVVTGSGAITIAMVANDPLAITGFNFTGYSGTLTVDGTSGIDVIKLGAFATTVNAGDGTDQIRGGSAVDTIDGGAGNDKIMAMGGADLLTGGAGSDQFRFFAANDSGIGALADRITDFAIGEDMLVFSLIDTNPGQAGVQGFAFNGTAAFANSGLGQIRYQDSGGDLLVQADVNGDGTADMAVILQGLAGQALSSGSFSLGTPPAMEPASLKGSFGGADVLPPEIAAKDAVRFEDEGDSLLEFTPVALATHSEPWFPVFKFEYYPELGLI